MYNPDPTDSKPTTSTNAFSVGQTFRQKIVIPVEVNIRFKTVCLQDLQGCVYGASPAVVIH